MRVLRAIVGAILALVAIAPLMFAGMLFYASRHRDPDGYFRATFEHIRTEGHAVVVPDVHELLSRQAFARIASTWLRVSARTPTGQNAFVGLAPQAEVERYLSGVRRLEITDFDLSHGDVPVTIREVPGNATPLPPVDQAFWLEKSVDRAPADAVNWMPSRIGEDETVALVVMNMNGSAPLAVDIMGAVDPQWLPAAMWSSLIIGGAVFTGGLLLALWPRRRREVVVTPPAAGPADPGKFPPLNPARDGLEEDAQQPATTRSGARHAAPDSAQHAP